LNTGGWSHCTVVDGAAEQISIDTRVIGVLVGAGAALPEPLLPQLGSNTHIRTR
jgi:hypothetical protein